MFIFSLTRYISSTCSVCSVTTATQDPEFLSSEYLWEFVVFNQLKKSLDSIIKLMLHMQVFSFFPFFLM